MGEFIQLVVAASLTLVESDRRNFCLGSAGYFKAMVQ